MFIAIVLHLIILHTVDGREVQINPSYVTSVHGRRDENRHITEHANCLIHLADGKFVSVTESCDVVRKMVEEALQ